ncbi:MAG: 3-isopropylmalate dehydratase small subunit [Paracoccus sp. (in: a-proteobacteria)]|nr:3-isopropylmalate dehydratase small subunit [Paracoccus sp. (in: a-proteobacteria)]
MQPFTRLDAPACPLPLANLDTDQLIPARFMKEPRKAGYGSFLLYDLRRNAEGVLRPGFILNRPHAGSARTLVARRNFGAGSSREAAVYALVDFGFRCVIAPSFGDIFAANAVNNGLLPATVAEADAEKILSILGDDISPVIVDLDMLTIVAGGCKFTFSIIDTWRTKLLNGWDDITLTQRHQQEIGSFAHERAKRLPWTVPRRPSETPPNAKRQDSRTLIPASNRGKST